MQKKKIQKNTKAHKKKHQWSPWHYLIVAGIVMVVYFFLQGNYGFIRYWQLQRQKKELIQQMVELKKQQNDLEREIDRLRNNYRYIEKIVREKYKMGKEDEKIFFMIPPSKK